MPKSAALRLTAVLVASAGLIGAAQAKSLRPVDVVNAFDKMAFEDRHTQEAILKYNAPDVIEHDPTVPGGDRAGMLAYFAHRDWRAASQRRDIIDRVIGRGDYVVVEHHIKDSAQDRGVLFIDIFRVKHGQIVEHWDVGQPIPQKTVNPHTMY